MKVAPRHVLIVKPSSLGDIIHALPAISALKNRFPHAHLTWLVKNVWASILEGNPYIDEIFAVDFSLRSWPGILQRLRQAKWDLVVDFQGLLRSGIIALVSGSPFRVGFDRAREGARYCYTHRVKLSELESVPWRSGTLHAVERNLKLAAYLGAETTSPIWHFPDWEEDRLLVQKILLGKQVEESENLVVIAPWSRSSIKCWPLSHFIELTNKVIEGGTIRPVLIGTIHDKHEARLFQELEPRGLVNLVGQVTLRQLPVLLRKVRGLVGNDSAPLHMAAGLGIPVVALYGPTHPRMTGPYPLARHRVMTTTIPCRPCGRNHCVNPDYGACLNGIEPEEVYKNLIGLLGAAQSPHDKRMVGH